MGTKVKEDEVEEEEEEEKEKEEKEYTRRERTEAEVIGAFSLLPGRIEVPIYGTERPGACGALEHIHWQLIIIMYMVHASPLLMLRSC